MSNEALNFQSSWINAQVAKTKSLYWKGRFDGAKSIFSWDKNSRNLSNDKFSLTSLEQTKERVVFKYEWKRLEIEDTLMGRAGQRMTFSQWDREGSFHCGKGGICLSSLGSSMNLRWIRLKPHLRCDILNSDMDYYFNLFIKYKY